MPAAILAILPQIIALIPIITTGVEHIIAWINSIRTAAQQTGQWTPALETAFLEALIATKLDPAYQPDAPTKATVPKPSLR